MFVSPDEVNVFACELVEVASNMTEVGDEFMIVAYKTEEFLYFCDIFEWDWPFGNSFHFFGINSDIAVRNNMTKVFHGSSGEFALFEFAVPVVLVEFLHDLFDVMYVLVFRR